jgi:hypothetical protein
MDETRERIRLKIPAPEVQSPPPPPLQAQPPVEPKPQEAPRPRSELMHMFVPLSSTTLVCMLIRDQSFTSIHNTEHVLRIVSHGLLSPITCSRGCAESVSKRGVSVATQTDRLRTYGVHTQTRPLRDHSTTQTHAGTITGAHPQSRYLKTSVHIPAPRLIIPCSP